ncbi:MAG: carbamate kinase [Spirochaetales bacterium]|uniref:Carbamate kinase n=1 Tax=Candidatus Thalassospirochaeta sargassi TaxID=3119039 RepID=A0AAJ1ICB2_9SPIO|nr:carbamate kinase [Spirochaetales bacterium]
MRKAVVENKESHDLAVIALGGNAIIRKGERGDIHQQFTNTRASMKPIVNLLQKGYNFVLTHGNGPQVGNLMLMINSARESVPEVPLGVADAMTEGSMGYMIEQCLQNMMIRAGIWRNVVTIPTQILIDKNDPSLSNPTKPIGPFYEKEEAEKLAAATNWTMKEDSGRGWRRYVASPYPIDIVEKDAIKLLIKRNYVVISGGGGGIPVFYEKDKTLEGIDCVIDKDLASMKIALSVGAKTLIIITSVPQVCLNFGKPDEKKLSRMTLAEARYYHNEGHFGMGSMAPKIISAIEFIQANPQHKVIITDVENLEAALEGDRGTTVTAY